MTNRQRLIMEGVDVNDPEALFAADADSICAICNAEIEKNLSPTNPACEGRWCDKAIELYLDKEAK